MRWKLEHILKKGGGEILFEDESVIAINKPQGLLVLPDRYNKKSINLYDLLKDSLENIFIVHRIDKDTSGVILFAKSSEAHTKLNIQFEERQVNKKYLAIAVGNTLEESGSISLPIIEVNERMKIDLKRGKKSQTDYKVIEKFGKYILLELTPLTGRMHQIRIHLSAVGLPILADPIYGDGKPFFLSDIKWNYRKKDEIEEKPLIDRTALHACSIEFIHPLKGNFLKIDAKLPKDMNAVLKVLRKYSQ